MKKEILIIILVTVTLLLLPQMVVAQEPEAKHTQIEITLPPGVGTEYMRSIRWLKADELFVDTRGLAPGAEDALVLWAEEGDPGAHPYLPVIVSGWVITWYRLDSVPELPVTGAPS